MTRPLRTLPAVLAAFLFIAGSPAPAQADSITLRRSVTLGPFAPVTLADAAELDGPAAQALGKTILAESVSDLPRDAVAGVRSLPLSLVRQRLEALEGVNWAFLSLRGADVRILDSAAPPPAAPGERTTRASDSGPSADDGPAPVLPGSVRELALRVLIKILRVDPDDLRVRWPESDNELLDEPVAGRTVHVQPAGSSPRMPLSITIYEGDRIVRTETVRPEIAVKRRAWVVSRVVSRGEPISNADATLRALWLEPGRDPAPAVAGKVTTRRLEPGAIIETADVTPPIAVNRGETIMLHCVSGAVALKTRARALEPGRDGEIIRLELEATRRRVMARVNGPGKAVLVVAPDEPTAPSLSEPTPGGSR